MNKWFLILTSLFCSSLYAGQQTGTVGTFIVRSSDGLIYFYIKGETASGRPDCAKGHSFWMIKDENSETGKKQFSMLLAAKLSGSQIKVTGTGECTRWGDGEDVNGIQLL
ncbi:hypothetical protein SOPP22_01380 [Shewanella sp. OPT22]|nr:hypothetical protein SOPP22_01380 [Shewanella sp. OPT22]